VHETANAWAFQGACLHSQYMSLSSASTYHPGKVCIQHETPTFSLIPARHNRGSSSGHVYAAYVTFNIPAVWCCGAKQQGEECGNSRHDHKPRKLSMQIRSFEPCYQGRHCQYFSHGWRRRMQAVPGNTDDAVRGTARCEPGTFGSPKVCLCRKLSRVAVALCLPATCAGSTDIDYAKPYFFGHNCPPHQIAGNAHGQNPIIWHCTCTSPLQITVS
jgi:hypothetical protein